jgi:hypothetical protein
MNIEDRKLLVLLLAKYEFSDLLSDLSAVCSEKALTLATNGDVQSAKKWMIYSDRVDRLTAKVERDI